MSNENKVVTNRARAGFAKLFRPDPENDKYSVTLIFDGAKDVANLKENVKNFLADQGVPTKGLEMPWKSGDEKADKDEAYEDLRGKTLVNCKTKFQPAIVDQKRQPILEENEFYSGCYCKAVISPYLWEYKKRKGVSFNVIAVQKVADGDRFGGSVNPEDYFEVVETEDVSLQDDFNL